MNKDRSHQVHYEKAVEHCHVRLLSEGGTSLAQSPALVCLDSIEVSQTCSTESQHTLYHSVTGACAPFSSPDSSLFSLPSSHARDLDGSLLPSLLRRRFEQQGLPLTQEARVTVHQAGKLWFIRDQDKKYSVRKLVDHLAVFTHSA